MIYVMLAEGFEEIEGLAFVDILRRANIDVQTVSVADNERVKGAHGIEIVADTVISKVDKNIMEAIGFPGGLPGAYNLRDSENIEKLTKYAYDKGDIIIGAICASPCVVLYNYGLLDGRKATVYPGFEEEMTKAVMCDEDVVRDGMIITSKGPGTTHKFAKTFVEIFADKETAEKIICGMVY